MEDVWDTDLLCRRRNFEFLVVKPGDGTAAFFSSWEGEGRLRSKRRQNNKERTSSPHPKIMTITVAVVVPADACRYFDNISDTVPDTSVVRLSLVIANIHGRRWSSARSARFSIGIASTLSLPFSHAQATLSSTFFFCYPVIYTREGITKNNIDSFLYRTCTRMCGVLLQ